MVAFSGISDFNFVTGSKTIDLCMSVLEEMVVVLLYIYAGLKVQTVPTPEGPQAAETVRRRAEHGKFGGRGRGFMGLAFGAVNAAASATEKGSSRRHETENV